MFRFIKSREEWMGVVCMEEFEDMGEFNNWVDGEIVKLGCNLEEVKVYCDEVEDEDILVVRVKKKN